MGSNVLILSGSSQPKYPTAINHKIYAERHGYRYRFDTGPYPNLPSPFFHKVAAILEALNDSEWIFWLDDDAVFMQLDVSLETVAPEIFLNPPPIAIFCKSPVNRGLWTYLSSGNFFIRNCIEARQFLRACFSTDLEKVKQAWNPQTFGLFTGGDQDAMVYQITSDPSLSSRVLRLEYTRFNTRPFHFERSAQHFLVHFTHEPERSKHEQMSKFAARFGLHEFLVPPELISPYSEYFGLSSTNIK